MANLPRLVVPEPISGSSGHTFIDGDTLVNKEGNLLRIEGLSAPEIDRLMDSGYFKPGTPGGVTATQQIERLAEEFGYNNVQYLTNPDGSPMMDTLGKRQLVRLTDDSGRDFVETLTRYGINKLGRFSSSEEIDKYRLGMAKNSNRNIRDPLNEFEKAELILNDAIKSEQWYDTEFAKAATDEQMLARLNADQQPGESLAAFAWRKKQAAMFSQNRVQQRHKDRTIDNEALHPWSESFDVGWNGVIESLYGAAELVGYKILTHIIKDNPDYHYEYNSNIVPVVSFGKSDKWKDHILKVGSEAGYEVLRGISKKFGLEHDSLDAGTPEIYKQKSADDTIVTDEKIDENNKVYSSYFHRKVL